VELSEFEHGSELILICHFISLVCVVALAM